MSTNPTPTPPFTLAAEVEELLRTKDAYLASSRSSAALSALTMRYEELQNSWQELTTPSEERQLQDALRSLEQRKHDWKESYTTNKRRLQRSNSRLNYLSEQQKLTLPQLIEQQQQPYSDEWQQSEHSIEQLKTTLHERQSTWPTRKQIIKQTSLSAYKQQQHECAQLLQSKQQSLTELQQQYEGNATSTTSLADRRENLTARKLSLAQQSSLLKQLWSEQETHENSRKKLQAKQQTCLQQLTTLKANLLQENDSLLSEQNTLVRGGWLSEDELPPLDFSALAALDADAC